MKRGGVANHQRARVEQAVPGPSTVDARHYTDVGQYQREIERIFHRAWLVVCPSSDLDSPRRYVVWDRFGQSVVVVRLDDGTLAAWHNVCQHRGARLVGDAGVCSTGTFRCPWHGFGYDLEGRVENVPLRESFDERELTGLRTPNASVAEWAGHVWLTLADDAEPLEDYLGEIKTELDGYGLDRYRTVYRARWDIGANWKTVIDGFNETWHVPFTHKNSLGGMVQWRGADFRIFDPHSMMTIPYKRSSRTVDENGDHRKTMLCHYLAFPNTIFSCFPTHLQMFTAWPAGPRDTVFTASHVMGPTPEGMSDEEWARRGRRDWEHFLTVAGEDIEVLTAAGRVYDSLGFRRNMFNAAEARLTAFHDMVNRLADGAAAVGQRSVADLRPGLGPTDGRQDTGAGR
jgi:phenylpropionate dioxygenase-like ring-hydroxylating dioxygenase large terminal subunit